MSCNINKENLISSLKNYKRYSIFSRAYFWIPLFVLYFSTIVSIKQVFLLESIYYGSVFIMEVPSGYFSDYFGRKRTLFLSSLFFCISYLLFFIGGSFSIFLIAQIFLATGFAFASGTDTSLHFALLSALKLENEYGQREADLASLGLKATAIAAVMGGLFAWLNEYKIAYALSFLFACFTLISVILMKDPESSCPNRERPAPPLKQLINVIRKLVNPTLKYLFLFPVFITILNHIPYELYQIYIRDYLNNIYQSETIKSLGPLISGFHTALTMLFASWIAGKAISIHKITGTKLLLLLAICLQTLMISILGLSNSPIIILLLIARGLPGPVSASIVRKETTPNLPSNLRATYFSIQSLLGRLAFAFVLIIFNLLPGNGYINSVRSGVSLGVLLLVILLIIPFRHSRL